MICKSGRYVMYRPLSCVMPCAFSLHLLRTFQALC